MTMLPSVFRVEDNRGSGFDPIPAGWYEAEANKSEIKETRSGGKMLSVAFQIIDGEHAKRVVYANFNLVNGNPIAVCFGHRELASLCDAIGIDELEDSSDLHGIPVQIRLKIEAGNAQYPDRNVISGYKSVYKAN